MHTHVPPSGYRPDSVKLDPCTEAEGEDIVLLNELMGRQVARKLLMVSSAEERSVLGSRVRGGVGDNGVWVEEEVDEGREGMMVSGE